MKVYAYDRVRNIVEVDLSIDVIIAEHIHPWRVDLLAPHPVQLEVDGKQLAFTPLDKISFAFVESDRGYIYVKDGEKPFRLSGQQRTDLFQVVLDQEKIDALTDEEFQNQFRCYLASFDDNLPGAGYVIHGRGDNVYTVRHGVYYRWGFESTADPYFDGQMFDPVRLNVRLPENMSWVLDVFSDWHPVLIGEALTKVVEGTAPGVVSCYIDSVDRFFVKERLEQLGVDNLVAEGAAWTSGAFWFSFRGTRYQLLTGSRDFSAGHRDLSINTLYADEPDCIITSRIVLFNLGQNKMHVVSPPEAFQQQVLELDPWIPCRRNCVENCRIVERR